MRSDLKYRKPKVKEEPPQELSVRASMFPDFPPPSPLQVIVILLGSIILSWGLFNIALDILILLFRL